MLVIYLYNLWTEFGELKISDDDSVEGDFQGEVLTLIRSRAVGRLTESCEKNHLFRRYCTRSGKIAALRGYCSIFLAWNAQVARRDLQTSQWFLQLHAEIVLHAPWAFITSGKNCADCCQSELSARGTLLRCANNCVDATRDERYPESIQWPTIWTAREFILARYKTC